MVLRTKCKSKTYISSNTYYIKVALRPVLKITSKLLVCSGWYSCNIDVSNLHDSKSQPWDLQMPKSHGTDIMCSGQLREEESSDCGSQKVTVSKGSHCSADWRLSVSAYLTDLLPQSQRFRSPRSSRARSASLLVRWQSDMWLELLLVHTQLRPAFGILLGLPWLWAITDFLKADWCACHASARLNRKQSKKPPKYSTHTPHPPKRKKKTTKQTDKLKTSTVKIREKNQSEKQNLQPKGVSHLAWSNQEHKRKKKVCSIQVLLFLCFRDRESEIGRKLLAMSTFQLLVFSFFGNLWTTNPAALLMQNTGGKTKVKKQRARSHTECNIL